MSRVKKWRGEKYVRILHMALKVVKIEPRILRAIKELAKEIFGEEEHYKKSTQIRIRPED